MSSTVPARETITVLYVTAAEGRAGEAAEALPEHGDLDVAVAGSVEEGLGVLADDGVDCIVSDHDLPDISGIVFLQAVRVQYPDLPFVLFTSEGDEAVASDAISARVTDYLVRERFDDQWGQLAAMIDRAVAYYRLHDEREDAARRVRDILNALPDMVGVVRDGRFLHANDRSAEFTDVPDPADLVGRPLTDLFPDVAAGAENPLDAVQSGDRTVHRLEETMLDAGGVRLSVELSAARVDWEDEPAVLVVVRDVGRRTSLEQRMHDLDRINAVLRRVDHVIINATSREELEAGVCERLVEQEPYVMAWIGEHDEEAGVVRPRASAGPESDYLREVEITVGDEPTGRGPTGLAVATGEIQVMQDIPDDPDFEPWRDEAVGHGFRSSAAVPLVHDGEGFGVLNLYADREAAFDDEEVAVLEELAGDVAYASDAIRIRERLEERVKEMQGVRAAAELLERNGRSLTRILEDVVDLIPPAFHYPEHTAARLRYGDTEIATEGFRETDGGLHATGETSDGETVALDVVYTTDRDEADLDPFLDEERALLDTLVRLVTNEVERRAYVDEIARVKDRFQAYIENASDVITVVDESGEIRFDSPSIERVLGYEPGSRVGTSAFDYIHPDDVDAVAETFEATVGGEADSTSRLEYRVRAADGDWVWVETAGAARRDPSLEGYVVTTRDVSERKEREQHLQVIDRVLRHNLRNDLNVIRGYAETLEEEAPDELRSHARQIVTQADRLLTKADKEREIVDVLTERPSTEAVDLATVARRVADRVQRRHPDARIAVDAPEDADADVVQGFEQALEELVENGVVHNDRDEPTVEVTVERGDATTTVRVADDGPGIPEMNVKVLTEEYETPLYHGSGLGLWLVHWLVSRSDGTLTFEDDEPRGTVATVTFPRAGADDATEPGPPTAASDTDDEISSDAPPDASRGGHGAGRRDEGLRGGSGLDPADDAGPHGPDSVVARRNDRLVLINRVLRHDVRNDMTTALGWGEELRDRLEDPEDVDALDRVLDAVRRTIELTYTARDYVEDVIAEHERPLEPVRLDEELRAATDRLRDVYPGATVTVGELPDVAVRANALLRSVFRNVLDNAVQHNDADEPHVDVTATVEDDAVTVRIADDGPGIPEERRDDVFGRGEMGLDDPSSGLGLRLVDALVTNFGGDVRIEDDEPRGTVVVIRLPLAGPDGSSEPSTDDAAPGGDGR